MKSKIKIYLSVFLLITTLIVAAALLTSCGDKVKQIYVDNAHAPRLTYVEGQELDLQKGILTAVVGKKGEETLIPMTDESVSVTGYDANYIGSQVLIVSYEGLTTTITVNVIPRLVAEGYETGYFTGDTFKNNKGKLKVAKDDATTFLVSMDDPRVSVETFDTTTPGEKTVTVKYTDSSTSYSCSFKVVVYDAATSTISIVYPKKTSYGSHETALDYTGGYFTIKGGADGKLEKLVDITDAMTSGYDLSAANSKKPTVTQTVTISYLGKTFTYTITVNYSSTAMIKDQLVILNKIDLTDDDLTLTAEQKDAAWIAASKYYGLDDTDKDLFTDDEVETIVRVASIAVSDLYREELKQFEDTFMLDGDNVGLVLSSYEAAYRDLTILEDSTELVNQYATILRTILEEYPDLTVTNDTTVTDEVFVFHKDFETNLVAILAHLTDLYETMSAVPEEWTVATLFDFEPQLYRIMVDIPTSPYYKGGYSQIYTYLSKWRTKDDFFEIFYTYYLYCNDNYGDDRIISMLKNIPWPKELSKWRSYWNTLNNVSTRLKESVDEAKANNTTPTVYMFDTTPYMYYYTIFMAASENIKANKTTDQMTYDLYNLIGGDGYVQAMRYTSYGYYDLKGYLADETKFGEMWNTYLNLVDLYAKGELVNEDGALITDGYEEAYEAVMNKLCELSPNELEEFLGSLNYLYGNTSGDIYALTVYNGTDNNGDPVSTYLSTLSTLMNAYYLQVFNEAEYEIFVSVLKAMESYARIDRVSGAKDAFKTEMKNAIDKYALLDSTALFDSKMQSAYTTYAKLYEEFIKESNLTVEENALAHINVILSSAEKINAIQAYLKAESEKAEEDREIRNEAYMIIFALYENARYSYLTLADMAKNDANLKTALYMNVYEIGGKDLTVEQIFDALGTSYWNYMLRMPSIVMNQGGVQVSMHLYDIYLNNNITEFLLYSADMLYAEFNESSVSEFSEASFNKVVAAYNKLDNILIGTLSIFNIDDIYLSFVERYTAAVLAGDTETLALADKLVDVARTLTDLMIHSSAEKISTFKSLMEEAEGLKGQLSSEENYDKYLKVMYEYYESVLEAMNNPSQE